MEGLILRCPIHLCDLFYFLEDVGIASFANDSTFYKINKKRESFISALETSSPLLFEWFNNNFMKVKSVRSHLIVSCTEVTAAITDCLLELRNRSSPINNKLS